MEFFLVISIKFEGEKPSAYMQKLKDKFDNQNQVDLNSDDFVTLFPETKEGKNVAINLNYKSENFKTAVFELLVKANAIGQGWKVLGPVKLKKYMFTMNLDRNTGEHLPEGINNLTLILNNSVV